jgi:hypothetical protein
VVPEWISAIAEAITALSILVLLAQVRDARKQMKADHERSRRQLANEHILVWTNSLNRSTSSARKLADLLDEEDCRKLVAEQELVLNADRKGLVEACLTNHVGIVEKEGRIVLSSAQVAEIRYLVVRYLNTLETVLAGWRHSISDQTIISEEFRYLLEPKQGHKMLKVFRQSLGDENYPAIHQFEEYLSESKKPAAGKPAL